MSLGNSSKRCAGWWSGTRVRTAPECFWCTIFLSMFIFSVHVAGNYVPIIRRNNCIYATLGTCYSEKKGEFKISSAYVI